jgi:hypothetical protein
MTATMSLEDWVAATDDNYLSDFIREGGASVKFAIAMEGETTANISAAIRERAISNGYLTASIDSAKTKISSIEFVLASIADQIDLTTVVDGLIKTFASRVHWKLPDQFDSSSVQQQIADFNGVGVEVVSLELKGALQNQLMKSTLLTRDFKVAMTILALARLNGGDQFPVTLQTVSAWLGGHITKLSQLTNFSIHAKVSKANARNIFGSLLTGLALAGFPGLVVTVDISQLMNTQRDPERINYTKSALLDTYEVLREFIDATDDLEHLLMVVTAPATFLDLETSGRGIGRYQALRARVYDEVRDRNLANPMSALIRVGNESPEVDQ